MKKCLIYLSLLFSFLFIGNVKAFTTSDGQTFPDFPNNTQDYQYVIFQLQNGSISLAEISNSTLSINNNYPVRYNSNNNYLTFSSITNTYKLENYEWVFNSNYPSGVYFSNYDNVIASTLSIYNTNYSAFYNFPSNIRSQFIDFSNPTFNQAFLDVAFENLNYLSQNYSNPSISYNKKDYPFVFIINENNSIQYIFSSCNDWTRYSGSNVAFQLDSNCHTKIISLSKKNTFFYINSSTTFWFNKNTSDIYTNTDIYYNDTLIKTKNIDYSPSGIQTYNINFHLNGGYVNSSDINLSNENSSGGSNSSGGGRHENDIINEDFSLELLSSEANMFIAKLVPKKLSMIFDGWYYDDRYIHPFSINDSITSDTDLYAKYRYEHVEDFLENTKFNTYTFDTNYEYAIISKGNNIGDIYLGLNVNKYDITVYQYDENIKKYSNEYGFCLVPIYSKDNIYYYLLDSTDTNYLDVLVLPKTVFENNNYDFLLTSNAYVTYTNDLSHTIITNGSGTELNTDLSNTYQTFQESLMNDENDLLTIFKNLLNYKDNRIFSNINSIWNELKKTSLYPYFTILIVGGLIILIIKASRRN